MQFAQTVRLVNRCFTPRTSCTGRTSRGLVYIRLSPSNDMQFAQTARLVNHCFTTRTSCTGRTSRGLVNTPKSL